MRASGAGARWHFGEITEAVKLWHGHERRMGHVIDRTDILIEFEERLEVVTLEMKMKASYGEPVQPEFHAKLKIYEERLHACRPAQLS